MKQAQAKPARARKAPAAPVVALPPAAAPAAPVHALPPCLRGIPPGRWGCWPFAQPGSYF